MGAKASLGSVGDIDDDDYDDIDDFDGEKYVGSKDDDAYDDDDDDIAPAAVPMYNFDSIVARAYPGFLEDIATLDQMCKDYASVVPQDSYMERGVFLLEKMDTMRYVGQFLRVCARAMQGHAISLPWSVRCAVNTIVRDAWVLLHLNQASALLALDANDMYHVLQTTKDVLRQNILYLKGRFYSSLLHSGPIDEETQPLVHNLIRLHHYGVYTVDSQPSGVFEEVSGVTGELIKTTQCGYLELYVRRVDWADLLRYLQTVSDIGYGYIDYGTGEVFETEPRPKNQDFVDGVCETARDATISIHRVSKTHEVASKLGRFNGELASDFETEFPIVLIVFARYPTPVVDIEQCLLDFYVARDAYIAFDEDLQSLMQPTYGALLDVKAALGKSFWHLPEPANCQLARDFIVRDVSGGDDREDPQPQHDRPPEF